MLDREQPLLIGVDGGGTGCRVAVGTSVDGVLARAEGGSANATSDPDSAIKNIASAVVEAVGAAGISVDALRSAYAHLGLAGVISDNDKTRISRALPYADTVVSDDRATAVFGALCQQDGYVLSVGTGAIVGASTDGEFRFVGGWGFQVSDQASGAWLGRKVLEQVLLCHDGLADHSGLTKAVFAQFKNDPTEIVAFSTSATPGAFGTLAPAVVASARNGDPIGRILMQDGAAYLMRGLEQLGFEAGGKICLMGGLGPHYASHFPVELLTGRVAAKGSALDGAFALAISGEAKLRGEK